MVRTDFIKKIVDAYQLDANLEEIPSKVGSTFLPVIPLPIPPTIVMFRPTKTEWSNGIRVPSGKKWKILSAHVKWTSDINAGNREIRLLVVTGDGNNNIFVAVSRNFQTASLILHYSFFPEAVHVGSASGTFQSIPFPKDLLLIPNQRITIVDDAAIAVGDTLTESTLIVEESDLDTDEQVER